MSFDDWSQWAICCTCKFHTLQVCGHLTGMDPCKGPQGASRHLSCYLQLVQLSFHQSSRWAILKKNAFRHQVSLLSNLVTKASRSFTAYKLTFTRQHLSFMYIPEGDLGTKSTVLVLALIPSPDPSIQMYIH